MNTCLKAGFSGVEIHAYPTPEVKKSLEGMKGDIKKLKLVTVHYPLHSEEALMLRSSSLLKRRIAIDLLTKEFKFLEQFKPSLYVVHPGKAYSPLEDFGLLKKACERHGMRLSLENGMTYPNNELGNVRRLCRMLGVGMTLDVGHAFLSKQDVYNLSPLKDVLEHVHLHNVGKTDHLRLSEGFISMPKVIEALKKINYDKGIVLEVHKDPDFFEALKESKKIMDLLWKEM